MIKKLLVPGLLMLLFSSCKKESANCDKNVASLSGTYSFVKIEIGTAGTFIDITSELEACELDDKLVLNANGTSSYLDQGTACSPAGNETGTWSVSSTGKMTINNGSSVELTDADITSFDCSTLVLTGFESSSPGDQFRLTIKK